MEVKDYLGKTGLARFLENCKNLFALKADLEAHTSEANPHNITKTKVGLENVDNTSDADKPVSTAQGEAIQDAIDTAAIDATSKANAAESNAKDYADTLKTATDALLENKVGSDELAAAIDDALTQAKESGEFDGKSGVYVGSGDMPEGYNVQIDPDGEAIKLPTKTSELENDSGFITKNDIPTKTSELDNDSGFISENTSKQIIARSEGQAPNISLLRNSKLVATETNPTVNGEICWTYE